MIFIHNRKAISNCLCQLSIMCDCDQCFSCFMKILQKFQKHILCFFIQSCKWFIQDQYFRIQRKDASKRYFSFLPAAQMIWRSFSEFLYSKQLKTIFCSLSNFCFRQSHLDRSKRNFLLHASTEKLRIGILKYISHLLMKPFCKLPVLQGFLCNLMAFIKIMPF